MKVYYSAKSQDQARSALLDSCQAHPSFLQIAAQFRRRFVQPILALTIGLLLTAATAEASHFRGANLTWRRVGTGNSVELTITEAWRVGVVSTLSYNWGDGSPGFYTSGAPVVASDPEFTVIRKVVTHTYAGEGPYTITGSSCCRIGNLVNAANNSQTVRSTVDLRNGNSGSPSISSPIILQMVRGGVNNIPLSFSDVDNDAVTFRLATAAESQIGALASAGGNTISISVGGVLSWNTSATVVGQLYAVQVIANDNHRLASGASGSGSVSFDFIVKIVDGTINRPPVASGSAGPFVVAVGQSFTNVITGTDPDGGNLTVTHQGLPTGGTLTPVSGTSAPQPLAATFAWTPTAADSGNSVGVTIVFTDPTGLQASKSFSISVPANQPPTANAGPDQNVTAGANCSATVALNGSGSDPENGPLTYTWSGPFASVNAQSTNVSLPVGQHTLTLTVTDNKGASATDTTVVTVADVTPPTLTVPANILASNALGQCGANVTFAVSVSDNCPGVSVNTTPASGSFFPVGTTVVTSIATDAAGLTTTASFTVTVRDTQTPSVSAVGDIVVNTAPGACAANVNLTNAVLASDNCPGVVVSYSPISGSVFNKGEAIVTATATDAAGNTSSCTFKVTVRDTELPRVQTPAADKSVECDGLGNVLALNAWLASNGGAIATDNCGLVTWTNNFLRLSDGCGATGSATVVFTAIDSSGNSTSTTATFTIADTTAPAITTAAANKTVECDGAGNTAALSAWLAANGGALASDACGSVRWTHNFVALSDLCGATGVATVTFSAIDECGNTSSATATFTIVDTTAPVLTSNVRDILPSEAPITFTVNATDLCGSATTSVTRVTAHAINGAGKQIDKSGSAVIQINGNTVTIVDGGGVGTIITIYASAVDECGNTATATYVVNVLRPANEGVGNGVDGNTPGHDNNGGSDDPGTSPGNPGAKGKKS